jgi:hypothetical protein
MLNGKRQPLSGANEMAKGDVRSEYFLGEAKQTQGKSLSLKLEWLEKIDGEAMAVDKYPLLAIEFLNGNPRSPKEWVSVPKHIFQEMFEVWYEYKKSMENQC